jgi:hypothetical protein
MVCIYFWAPLYIQYILESKINFSFSYFKICDIGVRPKFDGV